MSFLFWLPFVVVVVLVTLRLHQTGGRFEPVGYVLLGLVGLVVLGAFAAIGWIHAFLMAASGFLLYLLVKSIAAQLVAVPARKPRSQPTTPAEIRAERLKRGDISVAEFREEGGKVGRVEQDRLTAVSRQPEIAALLRRYRISFRQLCLLREQLSLIPDVEWSILENPLLLEELIELSETGKGRQEIARHFRGKETR